MDVDTKLDMVKDPTSGTDNYISQFVFESCEMRHEKREKRYFSIIVLLIVLLVATNVAWLFYEAQFQVQTSETVTTTTTQTVDATMALSSALLAVLAFAMMRLDTILSRSIQRL